MKIYSIFPGNVVNWQITIKKAFKFQTNVILVVDKIEFDYNKIIIKKLKMLYSWHFYRQPFTIFLV